MLSSLHRKWGFIGEMHATTSDTSLKKHRMHIWSHILCVTCIVAKAWSHSASPPVAGWMRRKWRLARVKRETKDTFGAITRGTDENAPLQAHNGDGQRGKNGQRRRRWWRKKEENINGETLTQLLCTWCSLFRFRHMWPSKCIEAG